MAPKSRYTKGERPVKKVLRLLPVAYIPFQARSQEEEKVGPAFLWSQITPQFLHIYSMSQSKKHTVLEFSNREALKDLFFRDFKLRFK